MIINSRRYAIGTSHVKFLVFKVHSTIVCTVCNIEVLRQISHCILNIPDIRRIRQCSATAVYIANHLITSIDASRFIDRDTTYSYFICCNTCACNSSCTICQTRRIDNRITCSYGINSYILSRSDGESLTSLADFDVITIIKGNSIATFYLFFSMSIRFHLERRSRLSSILNSLFINSQRYIIARCSGRDKLVIPFDIKRYITIF